MLDTAKYEYIELDMPNIFHAWKVGDDKANVKFGIDKDIKDFIIQAAIKFPMWKFVGISSWRRDVGGILSAMEAYRFYVYEDREQIGVLSTEHSRAHGRMYCIGNDRIANARERGSSARTKDLDKALKIMAKQFGARTIFERVTTAMEECSQNLYAIRRTKYIEFNGAYTSLTTKLTRHLMDNWDLTLEMAKTNGVDPKILETLPTKYEDYTIAEGVQECFDQGKGAVVTIHGNDYAVKEGDRVTIYGTDDLPDWLKRGVGMLKLVDKHALISGIGFKINEQSFFVMKGTEA